MEYKKGQEMNSLPWFGIHKLLPYLLPYRFTMITMVALGFLGGLVDIILPLFQEYAIDHFIAKGKTASIGRFVSA